jgi:hypothetical protein
MRGTRFAAIIGSILVATSATVHAQSCADGSVLQDYRKAARARVGASVAGIISPAGNGAVSMVPVSQPAPSGNSPKFAAFFLPATMFINASQLIDLEAKAGDATQALPAAWGMLLMPTAASDCRLFLVAPSDFDHVLAANDVRRKLIDAGSASLLLDALYRARFPERPAMKNIVDEGASDPSGRALFAEVLREPLVLTAQAEVLGDPLPTSGPPILADLPLLFDWQRSMWQFAWPESLRAMSLKTGVYGARVEPILQRGPKTWTESSIRQDLQALEDTLRALKPIGELAQADLANLVKLGARMSDLQVRALYGQQVAMLEREFGNQYTLLITRIESHHSALYAASIGATPMTPARSFDTAELMAYRPKAATKDWDFKTLVVQGATALIPSGAPDGELGAGIASAAAKGTAYLLFRDARDPTTGQARVQPEVVVALPVDALLSLVSSELDKRMPANKCELRYSHGDVRWDVLDGQLVGSVDVQAQVWACVRHKWVCFRGWKPHWCENEVKTRLFKTHGAVSVTAAGSVIGQGLTILITANIPYQATKTAAMNKVLRQPESRMFTIPPVEMQSTFFARRKGGTDILWVVTGRMPAMEPGIAAATAEALKAYLAEEQKK